MKFLQLTPQRNCSDLRGLRQSGLSPLYVETSRVSREADRLPLRLTFVLFLAGALLFLTACDQATSRPLSTTQNILYTDSFVAGETGPWQTEGDEFGRSAVVNERLVIEVNAPNVIQFTTLQEPAFADFVLEVDVTQLGGHPESSYGVLFRMHSPQEFYRFDITGSGMYVIERHNANGTWTRLISDWTPSGAIRQGSNVTNRLTVVADGANLSFYVNGELLREVVDGSYWEGNIALSAGTFGQTGLSVAFDNLVVRAP